MDELHAAIGRVQLKKLPDIVAGRRHFVRLLLESGLGDLEAVTIPALPADVEHSYWWWRLGVDADKLTCSKEQFCAALQREGVLLNPSYIGALPTTFDWFANRARQHPWNNPLYKGDAKGECPIPNALAATQKYFNLNIYESWGEAEAQAIVTACRKVERAYLK